MTAEKKDRRPLRIKNLADLKRHIKLGTELVATAHQYHPDIVGLTRVVTKVQTNLIPGTEYTIRGTLMNKATGEVFTVNGETITAEVKFTPKGRNGEVKVKFVFDASGITKSTSLVVFESLYRDDVEITTHKDIEDKDQTVTITPPPDVPQTGDNSNLGVWIGLGGVALGGAIACVIMYFKKKKDDGEK